ncbi:MFS transporter [Mobilisporobacter senegalensis]|uniref:MFS transporter n=1 Tax=Mobilisporobacter senegalensis TaxID=1329262 RepID=A0A3N1XL09_9FIRM|nr:MFS transporter [Mobilisporobacter senegalensis]ROR27399.1 MFS transporter [Mobilisporobacter senegalensis]
MNRKIKKIYFSNKELTEDDYHKSQLKLILEGSTAGIIFALTVGTFLTGFLRYLGASPQYCAIIGAVPQLGCILQLISPYVFERLRQRKFLICICAFIFRFSVGTIIFVPFLVQGKKMILIIIMIIYTLAFMVAGFVTPGLNNWTLTVAPKHGRGRFLAIKDITAMLCVSAISIVVSKILDYYKLQGNIMIGFGIMFSISLLISIFDFILISQVGEPLTHHEIIKEPLVNLIKRPLQDSKFRKIILFLSIWNFAIQFSVSFIPIFMLSTLGLGYSFISIVTVLSNVVSMFATYLWGKLADATTWFLLLRINGLIIAACYLGWTFVTNDNAKALVPVVQILLISSNGAFNMASNNLQFDLAPVMGKTAYLGVTAAVASVISFLGAILGSVFSKVAQSIEINILFHTISNLQISFFITSVLLITAILIFKHIREIL